MFAYIEGTPKQQSQPTSKSHNQSIMMMSSSKKAAAENPTTTSSSSKDNNKRRTRSTSPTPKQKNAPATLLMKLEAEIDDAVCNLCFRGLGNPPRGIIRASGEGFVNALRDLVETKVDEALNQEEEDYTGGEEGIVVASEELRIMGDRLQTIGANMHRLCKLLDKKNELSLSLEKMKKEEEEQMKMKKAKMNDVIIIVDDDDVIPIDAKKKEEEDDDVIIMMPIALCARQQVATSGQSVQREMGLLYVSVQSIYMQSPADIVASLGRPRPNLGKFGDVLTNDDIYGEWVDGFMAQGYARPFPHPKTLDSNPLRFREMDHIASLVRTNWIFSHMFLASKNGGKFDECVKLVERAAMTMRRVSDAITKNANALAQTIGFDTRAVEEIELVQEHELQVFVPRLAFDISEFFLQRFRERGDVVPIEEKSEARVAFEVAVCNVFSFGVCTDLDGCFNGVQLSATGLRKRYVEMTPEERVSSGSVLLKDIVVHMDNERWEQAVASSLVAARALAYNAAKLEAAVAMMMRNDKNTVAMNVV